MTVLKKLQEQVKNSLNLISVGNAQDAIVQITKLIKNIKQAENVQTSQVNQDLQIIAYNNLACAYTKSNKFNASLKCLVHVEKIQQNILNNLSQQELTQQKLLQIAMTHSNKCAVYSKMKQHLKAKRSIEKALKILQMKPITKQSKFYLICLYNYSIQEEVLGNLNESKSIIQQALTIINEKQIHNQMQQKFLVNLSRIGSKILQRESKVNNYVKKNMLSTDRSLFFEVSKRIKSRPDTPKYRQIQIVSHQNYDNLMRRKINFSHQITEHKNSSFYNKSQQLSPIKILNLNKIYKSGKMPRCNTAGTKRVQSPYHPKRPSTGKRASLLKLDQF